MVGNKKNLHFPVGELSLDDEEHYENNDEKDQITVSCSWNTGENQRN